jgi:hypothetical protein
MRALREMAVSEGYADASVIEEVEELGKLSQKLRRDMVNTFVTDRSKYKKLKKKAEELTE